MKLRKPECSFVEISEVFHIFLLEERLTMLNVSAAIQSDKAISLTLGISAKTSIVQPCLPFHLTAVPIDQLPPTDTDAGGS